MEKTLDKNPSSNSSDQTTSIDIHRVTPEEKYTIEEMKKALEKYRIRVNNMCEFILLYASKGTDEKILDEMHTNYKKELVLFEKMEKRVMKVIERDENGTEAPLKKNRREIVLDDEEEDVDVALTVSGMENSEDTEESLTQPSVVPKAIPSWVRKHMISFEHEHITYKLAVCITKEVKYTWSKEKDLRSFFNQADRLKRLYLLRKRGENSPFEVYYFRFVSVTTGCNYVPTRAELKALHRQNAIARFDLFGFEDVDRREYATPWTPYILTGYYLNKFFNKFDGIVVNEEKLGKYEKRSLK
jgi:hypothetical protein